ncbi:hypothetical protein EJD97_015067, partial [Solanum chilense]
TEKCEDVVEVVNEGSQFMNNQAEFNNPSFHIDVNLYDIRKRDKYSDSNNNAFSFITVDCNFNKFVTNVWDTYYNFNSTVNKESTEESIIEYINGYRIHVAAPWHTVDNIVIPVNIEQIFHWVLIVVSFNDRCIHVMIPLGVVHYTIRQFQMRSRNTHNSFPCIYLSLTITRRKALINLHIRNTSPTLKLTLLK